MTAVCVAIDDLEALLADPLRGLDGGGAGGGEAGDTGAIKGNTPSIPGSPGDVWMQGVGYVQPAGSTGAGPDTISLLFQVTGASGAQEVAFGMGTTAGDSIDSAGSTTFSGATINPIPEPGTALLVGLGLLGLSVRKRHTKRYGRSYPSE